VVRAAASIAEEVKPSEQRTIFDIPLIDPVEYGLPYTRQQFSPSEVRTFENSSTNLNRRRAAHVLKTYFCDDLTPITIPSDDEGDGEHGSNPACRACHYKLDPMAGFFRYHDANGLSDPERPNIYFSDGVFIQGQDYQNYLDNWRPSTESSRLWDVGYIRSASRPEINSYGDSLADLAAIVRHAPEVKSCLARRIAQYYLGDQQAVDPAWIADLARRLQPGPTSARGFKEVVSEVLLSHTFTTRDPDPHACYDRMASDEDSAVPCAVAHVVETNCAECHQSTAGPGRLDLTRWVETPDGFGFPHLDKRGVQLSAAETFSRMAERLSTTDVNRAMPLLRYIETRDRQDLFHWLSEQLEATP
jgi:mono/diheme cytochrome c family protein